MASLCGPVEVNNEKREKEKNVNFVVISDTGLNGNSTVIRGKNFRMLLQF